ncbi:MAG: NAD kinase [Candidatus Azobacteroides sp.]|nr:NAD kinase [Candidatus Azobacteroides sp.]
MKVGIFGSDYQLDKQVPIKRVFEQLCQLGMEVYIEKDFYQYLCVRLHYEPKVSGLIDGKDFSVDAVLSIGGDGTFLRTAAVVGAKQIPILGINTGRLGFLADVSPVEIENTLNDIFNSHYRIEERTLLHLKINSRTENNDYALNEIAIQKQDTSSMIKINAFVNEEYLTTYWGDGLIVATPTGSTAYSISVNGPIIAPQAKAIVLSPIAPHSLNVRPLVIPEDSILSLSVESRSGNFLVAVDGRSEIFPSNTKFLIEKATFTTKIIKRYNHTFYETLRNKLMWGADNRI